MLPAQRAAMSGVRRQFVKDSPHLKDFDLGLGRGIVAQTRRHQPGLEKMLDSVPITFMFAGLVAIVVAAFFSVLAVRDHSNDNQTEKEKLGAVVLDRLAADIPVSRADVHRFANALELSQSEAQNALEQLYSEETSETITPEVLDRIAQLLGELEMQQPYENLPAEVRQSLVRMNRLVRSASQDNQDVDMMLSPIVNALHNYVELADQKKRQVVHLFAAYAISVASMILGGAALFYSPSPYKLADHVVEALQTENRAEDGR